MDLSSSFRVPHSAVEGCRKKHPHLHLLANSPSAWESSDDRVNVNDRHDVNDKATRMVWSMKHRTQGCGKLLFLYILPKKTSLQKTSRWKSVLSGLSQHDEVQYSKISKFFRILKPFTIYQVSRECPPMSSESKDGTTPLHLQHRWLDLWQLLWRMKTTSRVFFPDGVSSELHKTCVRI